MQEGFLKSGRKSMEYNIKLTEEFLTEIENICNYISVDLNANDAAKRKKLHR